MDKFNKDNYREPISDVDLGKEALDFSGLSENTEEVLPLEEVKEEKIITPSIKDSITQETEILPSSEEPVAAPSIKDSTMMDKPKSMGAFPKIEIKEQEEPSIEEAKSSSVKIDEPLVEEAPVNVEIKEQEEQPVIKVSPVIEEVNPLKRKIEISEQEEPSIEVEAPIEIEESYKDIRDAFWKKINPANVNRFKELGLEETEENRSMLNDLSVKITFLDDDLEDGVVSEKEAISKIKEIQSKL